MQTIYMVSVCMDFGLILHLNQRNIYIAREKRRKGIDFFYIYVYINSVCITRNTLVSYDIYSYAISLFVCVSMCGCLFSLTVSFYLFLFWFHTNEKKKMQNLRVNYIIYWCCLWPVWRLSIGYYFIYSIVDFAVLLYFVCWRMCLIHLILFAHCRCCTSLIVSVDDSNNNYTTDKLLLVLFVSK